MSASSIDKKSLPWKWIIAAAVLAVIFVLWFLLPVHQWVKAFNQWVEGAGVWGVLVFGVIYIVATVALAPASAFSIAAGLAFGLGLGFLVVAVSATIGASLAFLIARYLARSKVEEMVERRPRFKAVDRAISEDGWKIVALLRLSPLVPFNLQNYFYGLTDVDFWHYVAATFFGILPGVLLYVYIGAAGKAVAGQGFGGPAKWALFAAGLIATLVVTILVTRKARARLQSAGVEEAAEAEEQS